MRDMTANQKDTILRLVGQGLEQNTEVYSAGGVLDIHGFKKKKRLQSMYTSLLCHLFVNQALQAREVKCGDHHHRLTILLAEFQIV